MRNSVAVAVAAVAVFAGGCGSDRPGAAGPAEPARGPIGCGDALAAADEFFESHPHGPADADPVLLAGRVADVEAACPATLVAAFGAEHLEPWSASGTPPAFPSTTID